MKNHEYGIVSHTHLHKCIERFRNATNCSCICGFIPSGILRLYPNIKHYNLSTNDFPDENKVTLLSTEEDLFMKIGGIFIEEYEKEFGNQQFYIS